METMSPWVVFPLIQDPSVSRWWKQDLNKALSDVKRPPQPATALNPSTAISLAALCVSLISLTKSHTSKKSPFDVNGLFLIRLYTVSIVLMKFSAYSHEIYSLVSKILKWEIMAII